MLSFNHMLKRLKAEIPWRVLVGTYLFRALEMISGKSRLAVLCILHNYMRWLKYICLITAYM